MAADVVVCERCRTPLEIDGRLRGALVNCGRCGALVDVPGLRDPLWLALRAGAVVAAIVAGSVVAAFAGVPLGAAGALLLLGLAWLLGRAL